MAAQINGKYVMEPKNSQRADISERVAANLTLNARRLMLKARAIEK
jgi:hypothetical protein